MGEGFLVQATVFLTAAVICVPLAKRLGMGSVLGYLLGGILIGPFVFGFIGEEGQDVMHFAEFGVVMMLFLIGLELEPAAFWRMRKLVLGLGGMQVGITTLLIFVGGIFMGFRWEAALAIGLALALSSTAIVLQTLKEKNLMRTASGQHSFAVLLFQDIAVIPMLALLPLLATTTPEMMGDGHHATPIENLPGWLQTIVVLLAVGLVVLIGRFVVVPLLRIISKTHLRELFSASALLIVVAIALLMQAVGLSPALGTFLAGVVLANSEFRHELESDLEPFKGLLLGLFFMAVGTAIDFNLIISNPGMILALAVGLMVLKGVILFVLGKVFGLRQDQNFLFFLGLCQIGEFAFVLLAFITQLQILDDQWVAKLLAVTTLTMTLTPILLLINEKLIQPKFGTKEEAETAADEIEAKCPVIIAGFGHFGSTLARFLRAHNVEMTILDNDSDRVDLLRKMGFRVYYGDATRVELLEAAGAAEAKLLIIAIGSPDVNTVLFEKVSKHFPHLKVIIRAQNRYDAYNFIEMGAKHIYRESLDTSVRLGIDVLQALGVRHYTAYRSAQQFLKFDEEALQNMASKRHDKDSYIAASRQRIEWEEQMLATYAGFNPNANDHAWDSDDMRQNKEHRMD